MANRLCLDDVSLRFQCRKNKPLQACQAERDETQGIRCLQYHWKDWRNKSGVLLASRSHYSSCDAGIRKLPRLYCHQSGHSRATHHTWAGRAGLLQPVSVSVLSSDTAGRQHLVSSCLLIFMREHLTAEPKLNHSLEKSGNRAFSLFSSLWHKMEPRRSWLDPVQKKWEEAVFGERLSEGGADANRRTNSGSSGNLQPRCEVSKKPWMDKWRARNHFP